MNRPPIAALRRRLLLGAAAAGLSGLLRPPPAAACEYFTPTLRLVHPWARASAADAPFVRVGMRFDEVTRDDCLIEVLTPVAEGAEFVDAAGAPIGAALPIPAGVETVLGERGPALHLLRPRHALEVARSYPLRLVFEQGGTVEALLNIDYARFT